MPQFIIDNQLFMDYFRSFICYYASG